MWPKKGAHTKVLREHSPPFQANMASNIGAKPISTSRPIKLTTGGKGKNYTMAVLSLLEEDRPGGACALLKHARPRLAQFYSKL
jgi:hypothetical protein